MPDTLTRVDHLILLRPLARETNHKDTLNSVLYSSVFRALSVNFSPASRACRR